VGEDLLPVYQVEENIINPVFSVSQDKHFAPVAYQQEGNE
jgi:hypothetical protein